MKAKKGFKFFILLFVIILGYQVFNKSSIKEITTNELAEKMESSAASDSIVFINVREKYEYESGHVKGMINIPLSEFESRIHEIPKNKEIVLFCRSGNRSKQAASILRENRYNHVVSVKGGIQQWNGPIER